MANSKRHPVLIKQIIFNLWNRVETNVIKSIPMITKLTDRAHRLIPNELSNIGSSQHKLFHEHHVPSGVNPTGYKENHAILSRCNSLAHLLINWNINSSVYEIMATAVKLAGLWKLNRDELKIVGMGYHCWGC